MPWCSIDENEWDAGTTASSTAGNITWVDSGTSSTTPYWMNSSTSTSTNTTTATITTTGTNTGIFIWGNEIVTPSAYMALARGRVVYYRERTERELREAEERRVIRQREAEERAERARLAKERSKELLLSYLTQEQRRTFEERGWFIVDGGQSQRRYRIRDRNIVANIDIMDGELVNGRLCCHCNHNSNVPIYDHLLAQKLHLQYNEPAFLQMANRHC